LAGGTLTLAPDAMEDGLGRRAAQSTPAGARRSSRSPAPKA